MQQSRPVLEPVREPQRVRPAAEWLAATAPGTRSAFPLRDARRLKWPRRCQREAMPGPCCLLPPGLARAAEGPEQRLQPEGEAESESESNSRPADCVLR